MTSPASDLSFSQIEGGVSVWIHVTPRARREAVGGVHGDSLRVSVAAAPEGGEANAACEKLLAKTLGVANSCVEIAPRSKNRRKWVRISGDSDLLVTRLQELATGQTTQ